MIYVDDPFTMDARFKNYSHMWTDGEVIELVTFAKSIGLKDCWLQYSRGLSGDFYHFDIAPSVRKKALAAGAQYMKLTDWIKARMPKRP